MPPHSVLFTSRAPIGYVAISENEVCTNQGFKSIVPNDNTDFLFLYYLLVYNRNKVENMGSGTTFKEVSGSVMKQIEVFIPTDKAEQQAIAKILGVLDDKIENNAQINHHLEQIAQAIFKSWFVDFEPFRGKQPSEWQESMLGDYVKIKRGGSPRPIQDFLSDTGLRWLKISDVTALQTPFVLEIKEHIKEAGLKKTVFLNSGTLVLSNSATPGIPKILCVDTCIHDGWLYFPKSHFSNEFLYLFFKHIRQDLVALGNGSVFTNLKTDILKMFPMTVPDKVTLRLFDETIIPIFRRMENCTRESVQIGDLRDSLLPRLMSGELSVAGISNAK
jgi:type I restriction enzyme S subunit